MGISLYGLTPATTYDALIKTGDNAPIDATLKTLSDGLGNNLPMEVSTTSINFTGTLLQSGMAVPTQAQVNAKQDTLVSGTNIKTINGTSVLGSGNITTPTTSPGGSTGQVQFNNGGAFGASSSLFWDNTNSRLGIGTSSPTTALDILGNAQIASATSGLLIRDYTAFNTFKAFYKASETPSDSNYLIAMNTDVLINSRGSGTDIYFNNSLRARFGNSTALTIKGSGSTSATTSLLVQNSSGSNLFSIKDDGQILLYSTITYLYGTFSSSNANLSLSASNGSASFGAAAPNASAQVEVASTTKGFLPPRMTTTQKNAISSPASGLVVYDTTTNKLCCYNGTSWNDLF